MFRHVQGLNLQGWNGSADHSFFKRLIEDSSQLAEPPTKPVGEPPRPKLQVKKPPPPSASVEIPAATTRASDVPEPEMVRIEPGTFLMGSAKGEGFDEEQPQHEVRIARPFAIGRYAVTFEEYDAFVRATKRDLPGDNGWGRGRRPVINVVWDDAVAYSWNDLPVDLRSALRSRLGTDARDDSLGFRLAQDL